MIIIAPYHEGTTGNDPEALGLAFHQGFTFNYACIHASTNLAHQDELGESSLVRGRKSVLSESFVFFLSYFENFTYQ